MFKSVKLGTIVKVLNGYAFKSAEYVDSGIRIIRITNVQKGQIRDNDPKFIERHRAEEFARFMLKDGDILISLTGNVGRVGVIEPSMLPAALNQRVGALEIDSQKIEPKYLFQLLNSERFEQDAIENSKGIAQLNLSSKWIEDYEIPLPHRNGKPDLDEQKRIAAILDKADGIRRKRQQALRLTDDFLRSVFLDMFGDPVTNPMRWELQNLNHVIGKSFRNGLSPSSKGTVEGKVLTLTAITTGSFSPEHSRDALFDRPPSENQTVTSDTFLICRGNGNKRMVGIGVFPQADMKSVVFPDTMIACTIDRDLIEPEYLQLLWSTAHVRNQIEAGARTTNGTYKVNQTLLGSIEFPLPPIALQKTFSRIVRASRASLLKANKATASSSNLFSSLQQRAFRGEL
ncbi:restriction endonuclease subunit S [Akkermansiaceae bacterium]|nr:restriction endonuclease subunit S [Akkermansiaceae bacterium]